jgi:radical SAM protein with 4Fe4S-binding SPASM domain
VRFTGGEPLLREDFRDVYLFARKQGLKVSLSTNATLITPTLVELFKRIPPLEKILITVYGMKKKSYEAVTKKTGSFESAWRGINLLLDGKIPFEVRGALLPANKDEIDEFESWAETVPWMDGLPPYAMFLNLRCRREETKNRLIRGLRINPEEGVKFLMRRKDTYVKAIKEFSSKFMHPPGDRIFSCGSGLGLACVDAYGYLYPCLMLKHPDCAYDLNQGSLRDALEEFFPKLRRIKSNNSQYLVRCANCFLKGLCEQCPAKSCSEYGNLDTPVEYLCDIAHAQARFLGLLGENEMGWKIRDWKERINRFAREGVYHESKS